jgi:hypothetical protein
MKINVFKEFNKWEDENYQAGILIAIGNVTRNIFVEHHKI